MPETPARPKPRAAARSPLLVGVLAWVVGLLYLVFMAAAALGMVWIAWFLVKNPSLDWGPGTITNTIRLAIFAAVFFTGTAYFIRWLTRLHAARLLAADLERRRMAERDRADRLIEMVEDWQTRHGAPMPDTIVAGLTRLLASDAEGEAAMTRALADLAPKDLADTSEELQESPSVP